MADAPVLPITIVTVGGYLVWFGVHYWRSDVKWPSDPVKAVLTGKSLPSNEVSKPTLALGSVGTGLGNALTGIGAGTGVGTVATGVGTTTTGSGSGAGSASSYNSSTLQTLWTSNGGSSSTANIAQAIAQAESSGNPQATSSNPDGGTNVGLWQLDTKGKGAGYSVEQLKDANTNARVTVMASVNGTNWSAWETYATGAYKKFLV